MNINQLFDQFVGGKTPAGKTAGHSKGTPDQAGGVADLLGSLTSGKTGSFAGGLAAGGLLGTLMGNKKMRKKAGKVAGGAVGYGGSAVLGALALKAYQNWQAGQGGQDAQHGSPAPSPVDPSRFDPRTAIDATGQPMQLALVKAMIAAANADGHIDQEEQSQVFDAVDRMDFDADAKAVIFDVLRNPPTIAQIAGYATGLEQASELYIASRLAIDPDLPAERRYLDDLAKATGLPDDLRREVENMVSPKPQETSVRQISSGGGEVLRADQALWGRQGDQNRPHHGVGLM